MGKVYTFAYRKSINDCKKTINFSRKSINGGFENRHSSESNNIKIYKVYEKENEFLLFADVRGADSKFCGGCCAGL